ncbi:MAG: hypothetical protein V9G29_14250 [Burkholderiaceae bacterium]
MSDTPNLPNPRHASRVPSHIGKAQFERIRQAAYRLPQVVKPGDYIAERSAGFEEHLDKLGLVLLQKPVAGARPSRWIAPGLMDSALAHLDAVGNGPAVRPLMLERTAALEAMGVTRDAGVWTRLISHALTLSEPGWKVPVLFRVPVERRGRVGLLSHRRQRRAAGCHRPADALPARRRTGDAPRRARRALPRGEAEPPRIAAATAAVRMRDAAGDCPS